MPDNYDQSGAYSDMAVNQGEGAFNIRTVVDPRTEMNGQAVLDKEYLAYIGAMHWMRYAHTATDWNDNEIKWTNINTPGPNFLIDKKWFIEYEIGIEIKNIPVTSTDLCPFRGSESYIMLRPYPMNSVAESITTMFNNRTITTNTRSHLYPRMEYWPQAMLKLSNGCCPHRKPNGQTFADMEIRKGNSPFCSMVEFNDQDYPNTTLINIIETKFKEGTVARGSSFERMGYPRSLRVCNAAEWDESKDGNSYKVAPINAKPVGTSGITDEMRDQYAGIGNWGTSYLSYEAALAIRLYEKALQTYTLAIKNSASKYVPMEELRNSKQDATKNALDNVKKDKDMWDSTSTGKTDAERLKTFDLTKYKDKFIDLDLIPNEYVGHLMKCFRAFYREKNAEQATMFFYGSRCLSNSSYEMRVKIREPVIAEPLDYTSSAEFGRTMWHINNIELKYNMSNYLNSMLAIDDYRLMSNSDSFWCFGKNWRYVYGQNDGKDMSLLDDNHIQVHIKSAPQLIFNVATPFTPPKIQYICQHRQFKRFESHDSDLLKVEAKALEKIYMNPYIANQNPIKTRSANLSLTFHPNSIFIWVAQRQQDRNQAPHKFTRADSYAKISKLTITYGNSSNLLAQFDDHELFQMSLRNGLQDRSFLDWNATMKNITTPTDFYGNASNLGWTGRRYVDTYKATIDSGKNETVYELSRQSTEPSLNPAFNRYAGVGSVVRLIPGIDLVNGNGTNPLIAGMRAGAATIQIEAEFVPLNAYEATDYALNVMFEYDGVCTIRPGECDLGMIAIESFEQLKNAPRARTFRESHNFGAGLGESVLKGLRLAQNVMSNSGIVTRRRGSGYINAIGNLGRSAKMSGGKLISQGELFKRY